MKRAERLKNLAEKMARLSENEAEDKVVSLEQAVRQNIQPGMSLVFDTGCYATIYQIMREFRGKKPEFTLINPPTILGFDLIHLGLVKKLIATRFGEAQPKPHVSQVFGRAYKQKMLDFEVWSLGALYQRLLAGALNFKFLPTKFMLGTSMAQDNQDSFQLIDDPFGSGEKVAVLKALNPDLCLVHALACDRNGNAICPDSVVAFASTQGTVLTTERLVSTDFIRKHSSLVKIPGYLVKSVSVVPLGSHPIGLFNMGLDGVQSYSDDTDFLIEHHEATREPSALDSWLKEWVFGCANREDYLSKLGYDRIVLLKGRETLEGFRESRLTSILGKVSTSLKYEPGEMMIIAASRKASETIIRNGYKVILCGLGVSALASFLTYYSLRDKNYNDVQLTMGGRNYGLSPSPGHDSAMSIGQTQGCKMLTDRLTGYPLIICGKTRCSLGILGAAQVDKHGNLNSGRISETVYVMGPGGGADAAQASEAIVVMKQSKDRFLNDLPYVTSFGSQVKTLISDLGVFEKIGDNNEFTLVGCLPTAAKSGIAEQIARAKNNCGWELKVSNEVKELAPPSFDELMMIRLLDPDDHFRH